MAGVSHRLFAVLMPFNSLIWFSVTVLPRAGNLHSIFIGFVSPHHSPRPLVYFSKGYPFFETVRATTFLFGVWKCQTILLSRHGSVQFDSILCNGLAMDSAASFPRVVIALDCRSEPFAKRPSVPTGLKIFIPTQFRKVPPVPFADRPDFFLGVGSRLQYVFTATSDCVSVLKHLELEVVSVFYSRDE